MEAHEQHSAEIFHILFNLLLLILSKHLFIQALDVLVHYSPRIFVCHMALIFIDECSHAVFELVV